MMNYPKAYIDYLVYFHGVRDYFECPEILEKEWKKVDKEKRQKHWVGLIQVAVALYHHRRGNLRGSAKLFKKSIVILQYEKEALTSLALDYDELLKRLTRKLEEVNQGERYKSINLPILSESLISLCKAESERLGFKWGNESDLSDEFIVHKHIARRRFKSN